MPPNMQENIANQFWMMQGVMRIWCAHGVTFHKHNTVRDQLAEFAKQSGATAQIEQRTSVQIRDYLQLGPGARPTQAANLRILDQAARDIWMDVKIVNAPPEAMASQTIRQAKQEKRRAYGCTPLTTQKLYDRARPFVIKQ